MDLGIEQRFNSLIFSTLSSHSFECFIFLHILFVGDQWNEGIFWPVLRMEDLHLGQKKWTISPAWIFYLWAILYLVKICSLRNYREDHLSTLVFPSPLDVKVQKQLPGKFLVKTNLMNLLVRTGHCKTIVYSSNW